MQQRTIITPGEKRAITENPFWEDLFSMGTQLSKELWLMHHNHKDQSLQDAYIYNVLTGETFTIKIEVKTSRLKKCHNCDEWHDVARWPGDSKVTVKCELCGTTNHYSIMNDND